MPVVLLLCWVYLLLEILHRVEGLCCDAARLDGSQAIQWLSNPHDVPELTIVVQTLLLVHTVYKLIWGKKKKKKVSKNNNYTLITFASYSSFFVYCILFIGVDFKIKTVELRGKKIRLQIW